ncbi:uncharacterized protein LOC129718360 [Wyeomyia smithii]|uniref:uncharacterized protein LOC129718360 n=1 Tax=Wyeomyia smithii TaxID=174621 RepID=UPI002467CABA|nr:uncharacterized protein LOC129718360 [Wyeomyia smithii]
MFPSSTRYCRPISIEFVRETADTTRHEYNRMITEISQLHPFVVNAGSIQLSITFELIMTMADGKTTNTTSAQRCYFCSSTSAEFNNIDKMLEKPFNKDFLDLGLSSLHCWIISFECFLHIAYRLGFCKWTKTGYINQFNSTKQRIQKEFFAKLGLHVDKPRTGFGNSNNGNTARRFFSNAEVSSEITEDFEHC